MNETLGASFSIDITSLKAGLAQANRLIRESESEFKSAAASMDDWTESQEGLEARIKHLNTAQDLQKKKVAALQSEYDRLVADGLDPTSAAAVKLRTDINKEQEALNKTEKELQEQTDALEHYRKVAELTGKDIDDVIADLKEMGDAAEDAGDGFTVSKGAIAGFIANGISSLVSKAGEAINSLLGLAESTREYRTELAKLSTAASVAGASTDYIKDKWHDMGAVLGDEGAVAEGLNNLMAAGFTTEKEMDAITQHLEGAAIKWKDTLKFEGLSDGLQETLATGAAVGSFGEMLERSGVNLETFNEGLAKCKTEAEQQDYVLQQLSKLGLSEVSEAYREQNAGLIEANKSTAEYTDKQAKLGAKMEPITTAIQNIKSAALDAVGWALDNLPTVGTVVAGVTAAIVAQKIATLAATAASKGMTLAQYAMATAQKVLNAAMSANPIGLIILAVTALVAAFVHLWKNCEGFRNFWIGLWDGIKNAAKAVVDWFSKAWTATISWFKDNWKSLLLFITNPIAGIFKYFYDNFEGFRNFVDNIVSSIKQFFVNLWNGIVNAYHTVIDPWIEIFKRISVIIYDSVIKPIADFFSKLWSGISEGATKAWNWIVGVFTKAATWYYNTVIKPVKDFFVGMWDGLKNGATNAWNGIKSVFSKVANFFGDIFGKAWEKVKAVFSVGGKIFDGIKDGIVTAFKTVVNAIIRGINKVVSLPFKGLNKILDKIHGIEIVGVKPFNWLNWRAPVPQIPELAKGGVVRGATHAIIGEDGAEAVVPLERNRQWIRAVAEEMATQQKQSVVVNQTNNYSQAHSRYELYKSKQATAAAVRLAMGAV